MTLARAVDCVAEIWAGKPGRTADVWAAFLLLVICAATVSIGAVHTHIFGHDIFIVYDAGWRVLNGQRPDVDFSPSMGPLLGLLAAAGLKLARNSVSGVGYTSALVGAIAGISGYALCQRRMAGVPAVLGAAVVTLIATAPFPIGWPPNTSSHAMVYNRYSYALLGVVVLECFRPGAVTIFGGFSTGVISAALLFLKPSFGLVAIGFALVCPALKHATGLLGGLAAGILAMMTYLHFNFGAVWNDFRLMSAAKGAGLSLWAIRWAFLRGLADFLPIALLALLVSLATATYRPLFWALIVYAAGALLLATNAQPNGFPLSAILAILLAEHGRSAPGAVIRPMVLVLLCLVCWAPELFSDASGLVYGFIETRNSPPDSEVARFREPHLANLLLYDLPDGTDADLRSSGRVYVKYVNDGVDLIRRFSAPAETIFTLDMANPFPYALLRKPAHGGSPALAFDHTFNDQHKPSTDWLFGAADIVMVPKHPASSKPDADALFRNYLADIRVEFVLCGESDYWWLYKRACANAP